MIRQSLRFTRLTVMTIYLMRHAERTCVFANVERARHPCSREMNIQGDRHSQQYILVLAVLYNAQFGPGSRPWIQSMRGGVKPLKEPLAENPYAINPFFDRLAIGNFHKYLCESLEFDGVVRKDEPRRRRMVPGRPEAVLVNFGPRVSTKADFLSRFKRAIELHADLSSGLVSFDLTSMTP